MFVFLSYFRHIYFCSILFILIYIIRHFQSLPHFPQTVKQLRELLPNSSNDYINKCVDVYGPHVDAIMDNIIEGKASRDIGPPEGEKEGEGKKKLVVPHKEALEDKVF